MGWMLLYYTLELFKWLIVIRAVLSWFVSPYSAHPAVVLLRRLTDPILRPLSNLLPNLGGVDFSAIVAFVAILLLQSVIVRVAVF
jgi:YggT family protein